MELSNLIRLGETQRGIEEWGDLAALCKVTSGVLEKLIHTALTLEISSAGKMVE